MAAELTVTATASAAVDTEVGRVVPVRCTVADADGAVLATLDERFAIRGRTGAAELSRSRPRRWCDLGQRRPTPRAAAAATSPSPRRSTCVPFAAVSGDHNPIHTDRAAALLAGLESPIVHGMWLSAAAQHVAAATDGKPAPPARLVGWTARFLGMVQPGDEVDFRVDRVGIDQGAEVVEVAARVGCELVMSATARLAAPKTVYAFPGQGIQHKGMGMEVRARSKAARKVWDRADKHTRETLGFSILHVVRDNPTSLIASGVHYHHPDGVLYLTQFTQVAMATVAAAQVAEMREAGAFVEGAIACGHSVGEYNALACVTGVYRSRHCSRSCSTAARRCTTSCRATSTAGPTTGWPRSGRRRSASPTTTSRRSSPRSPSAPASSSRSSTSTCAARSTRSPARSRGLEALEDEVERRREISGGKRAFILVPGIDVPFHSRVLRVGVADFRRSLERVMPRDKDPDADRRPLHPQPGAAAVHPRPRLRPGDPRSGARRAARRGPRRLRHLAPRSRASCAARSSSSCWPGSSPARCAGSRRRTCCSSRRPRAASASSGSSRSASSPRRRVAEPGHQHAQAARVLAQHGRSAELRARRGGAVRHRHRPRAGAGRSPTSAAAGRRCRARRGRAPADTRRRTGRSGRCVRARTTSRSTPPTPPWR